MAVQKYTNTYASLSKNWGRGYLHDFRNVNEDEFIRWHDIVSIDDVKGGASGDIHLRCVEDDPYH